MYRQFLLRHNDHRLTCWLRDDPRLRPGALVTLRDSAWPDRYWEIVHAYGHVEKNPPETRWRVGGLL